MPFASTTPALHALHVNTSSHDTAAPLGVRSDTPLRPERGAICETLSNIKPRQSPDALQRALTTLNDDTLAPGMGGSARSARPNLQTCVDKYNDILDRSVVNRQLQPKDHAVSHAFVNCGDALTEVVACRNALDRHEAGQASSDVLRSATSRLEAASNHAAQKITDLRQALNERLRDDRGWQGARVILAALALAASVLIAACPPAGIALTVGLGVAWVGTSATEILVTDLVFRCARRDMEKWVRELPSELVAAEQRLRAKAATTLQHAQPAAC